MHFFLLLKFVKFILSFVCQFIVCTQYKRNNRKRIIELINHMHIYALVQNLVCLIPTLSANMSQLVKDRFKQLIDTAIVITGTNEIVPAVVFHKLGRLSAYVEHYYLHTERLMILVVEPITDPRHKYYIPQWRDELLENILLKLASTGLVAGDYYTYVHSFMARYFLDANLLRKLAFALQVRHS